MNYLLDNCALLWLVNGDERLSPRARKAIATPGATVYLSVLAAAELAIKAGKGRIQLPRPVESWIRDAVRFHHPTLLPLEPGPAASAGTLPWIHTDPFDRLLVATARHHSLAIITSDVAIPQISRHPDNLVTRDGERGVVDGDGAVAGAHLDESVARFHALDGWQA